MCNYLPSPLYRYLEEEDPQEECQLVISGYLRKAACVVQPRQPRDYSPIPSYLGVPPWLVGIVSPAIHYAIVVLVTLDRFDYYTCLKKLEQDREVFYTVAACHLGNLRLVKQIVQKDRIHLKSAIAFDTARVASIDVGFYRALKEAWKNTRRDVERSPLINTATHRIFLERDDPEICKALVADISPDVNYRDFVAQISARWHMPVGPNLSKLE